MPKYIHDALAKKARAKGMTGRRADNFIYGIMNNMGVMHGNKETSKGREMEREHQQKSLLSRRRSSPV